MSIRWWTFSVQSRSVPRSPFVSTMLCSQKVRKNCKVHLNTKEKKRRITHKARKDCIPTSISTLKAGLVQPPSLSPLVPGEQDCGAPTFTPTTLGTALAPGMLCTADLEDQPMHPPAPRWIYAARHRSSMALEGAWTAQPEAEPPEAEPPEAEPPPPQEPS